MNLTKDEKLILLQINSEPSKLPSELTNNLIQLGLVLECCINGRCGYYVASPCAKNIIKEIQHEKNMGFGDFKCLPLYKLSDLEVQCIADYLDKTKSKEQQDIEKFWDSYDKQWDRFINASLDSDKEKICIIMDKMLTKFGN